MAATPSYTTPNRGQRALKVTVTAQNDAVVFSPQRPTDMTIQATGAFTSAHIKLLGSNDNVTFAALPTTAIDFTATGIKSVAQADLGYQYYQVIQTDAAESHSAFLFWNEQL